MAKKRISKDTKAEVTTKSDIEGFRGGIKLDLSRKMDGHGGQTLGEVLSSHFKQVLEQEISNNEPRMKMIRKWNKMYRGDRESKNFPWINAANCAIPVSRSNADAIAVRVVESVWGKQKIALFSAIDKRLIGVDKEMEDWFNWYQRDILDFKGKMLSPILQSVKTGTGVVKIDWLTKRRTIYRYATESEIRDKSVKKFYTGKNKTPVVKEVITESNGPQIYSVDREDFIISANALDIQSAYLVGMRKRYYRSGIKAKETQEVFFDGVTDKIYHSSAEDDETLEAKVKAEKKEIDYRIQDTKPTFLYELWVNFDVDEDGEPDSIVLTMHRETGTICNAIYNPIFKGFRPFEAFIFFPSEYHFDGEGVVEILEKPQVELDGLHNRRLDRLTLLNAPETFVVAGSGLENYKRSPGKVTVVKGQLDAMMRESESHDVYPSTFQEEQMLVNYMDRAVGITPAVMGVSTAERPVFRETIAHLQEANRKFAFGINNEIRSVSNVIYMIIEMMAQYQPTYRYKTQAGDVLKDQTVQFPGFMVRDSIKIECIAANEMLNQEVRRERELTIYQLLKDYYDRTAMMAQILFNPEAPPDYKKLIVSLIEKGDNRIERILENFDERNAEAYRIDVANVIDVNALTQQQPQPMPEEIPWMGEPGGMVNQARVP